MQYKTNWQETKQRLSAWYKREKTDRPLITLYKIRPEPLHPLETEISFDGPQDSCLSVEKNCARIKNHYALYEPVAEAFPQFNMNFGAGTMAFYLGAAPEYANDTVWIKHCIEDYDKALPLRFDPENEIFKQHLALVEKQVELTRGTDIFTVIPDIQENIDILAGLRDPQTLCYDLYDWPENVKRATRNISDIYMDYYNAFYERVKREDDWCAYTAFNLLGEGKTAKVQCDFAALLSPEHFDEIVLPALKSQCNQLDNVLFHLDGPEAFPHVDSLMGIEKIDALQWTPGAGNPGCGDERWFPLYEKVLKAGKGLWLDFYLPGFDDAVAAADRIVRRFGSKGMFFQFLYVPPADADRLLLKAERDWK